MSVASITIVGAGAMGCYFAARLAEVGIALTVIDVDQTRIDKIAAEGIRVKDGQGERCVRVRAMTAAEFKGPVDLVMLFTKGMHSAAAMKSVAHLAMPGTLALTLQNGLGNAEIIAKFYPKTDIVIGITLAPADLEGANVVSSRGKADTVLGPYQRGESTNVKAVAEALRRAGFPIEETPNIHERIWEKLAFNAAMNAISTITNRPNGRMDTAPGRRLLRATAQEVIAVASALGIHIDSDRLHAKIADALTDHREHRPSMLQDYLAGRQTEIESINGAVVEAGRSIGVPTPINATLADLVRMIESS